MISSSTGNKETVAPNSGVMFEIVALSDTVRDLIPSPKNSTKQSTTPTLRSFSAIVSTASVAVTPSGSEPMRWTPITFGVRKVTGSPKRPLQLRFHPPPIPIHPAHLSLEYENLCPRGYREMRSELNHLIGLMAPASQRLQGTPSLLDGQSPYQGARASIC